jgi:hypothetical protein
MARLIRLLPLSGAFLRGSRVSLAKLAANSHAFRTVLAFGRCGRYCPCRLSLHFPSLQTIKHETQKAEEIPMSEHVYRMIEVIGSSPESIEGAIGNAVEKASKTLRELRWFEVLETRGHVENGKIAHYQVKLKLAFTLE